jgi:hypothetical protein
MTGHFKALTRRLGQARDAGSDRSALPPAGVEQDRIGPLI